MPQGVMLALMRCRLSCRTVQSAMRCTQTFNGENVGNFPIERTASTLPHPTKLYKAHVPTSALQKVLLGAGSAVRAIVDPTDDGSVATLGETTGEFALSKMRDKMKAHPVGRKILADRPRVRNEYLPHEKLHSLPPGTFGHAYVSFMEGQGLNADARAQVRFVDDEELAYVAQRYRDIHDFIHCLLDFPSISEEDEIAVKWFEAVQTGLPMCYLSGVFGPLRLKPSEQLKMYTKYMPWAIETGRKSTFLLNVYYEKHFEDNLDELRASLDITPPPS
eukprot:m.122206 g.122206  ORF g.122206 m.122206 type:complete len:276 (-) comp28906_c1_seq2:1037-1864(-)